MTLALDINTPESQTVQSCSRSAVQTEVLDVLGAILKLGASQYANVESLSLTEAGIDSLGLVEAVFSIEERFDVTVPFNANEQSQTETASLMSVGQLLEQVVDLVMQKRYCATQLASA